MTQGSNEPGDDAWPRLITAARGPLGSLVVAALVLDVILLPAEAQGGSHAVLIFGVLVVLLALAGSIFFLAYKKPKSIGTQFAASERVRRLTFDQIVAELLPTISRLEQDDFHLAKCYRDEGDFQRLVDGLYSGILYASGAVPTGFISAAFYGNLMDWDEAGKALRVRYVKGPYNDGIICRRFPIEGPKQGIAGEAVKSGKIQIYNSLGPELKERGEPLLKAMLSIPVPSANGTKPDPGAIHAINIDSVVAGVFPQSGDAEMAVMQTRAQECVSLVQRVNRLRAVLKGDSYVNRKYL